MVVSDPVLKETGRIHRKGREMTLQTRPPTDSGTPVLKMKTGCNLLARPCSCTVRTSTALILPFVY